MKRLEFLFVVPLCLLALFVGHEALGAHERAKALANRTASFGATRVTDSLLPKRRDSVVARAAVVGEAAAPVRDIAEARRRLEMSGPGTYIGDVLAARDSAIARWPERRTNPLRVWVQTSSRVPDFSSSFAPLVRDAFVAWSETGIPVAFTFVFDSASADIRVTWIDRFQEAISGKTLWAHDASWWIVDAQIVLAVHHRSGDALDPSAMKAIALHEVGHLIGLDHTPDTTAIMTPKVRVKELSAADRATAQLLYLLPPGRVGSSAGR
jgi:hypothetical protein